MYSNNQAANKLIGTHEIKVVVGWRKTQWYRIVGESLDGCVLYGINENGEERRISFWHSDSIRKLKK